MHKIRGLLAVMIVGLYVFVVVVLLINQVSDRTWGDISEFFVQMSQANFLLAPVGFVLGYYFSKKDE